MDEVQAQPLIHTCHRVTPFGLAVDYLTQQGEVVWTEYETISQQRVGAGGRRFLVVVSFLAGVLAGVSIGFFSSS